MNKIKDFSNEYDFLSNFYPCRIIYNGYSYTCVEAAFQAEKCADPRDRAQFSELLGAEAKRLGRAVELREGWEDTKTSVMRDLLRIKFSEHPELLNKLLDTGDAQLIEGNRWHDNFWGDCTCVRCAEKPGRNVLGRLLMDLRSSMQSNTPPEDMPASFRYMNVDVKPLQLFSQAHVLALFHYNGADCETLDLVRERYRVIFGAELVWRYPIFDMVKDGGVIIPVREGFLWLPYDEDGVELTEYFRVKDAHLLEQKAVGTLLRELNAFANGLQTALADMLPTLGGVLKVDNEPFLTIPMPNGQILRAVVSHDMEYPSIQINLEGPDTRLHPEQLCYVEHNPNRQEGHQLCICAYTAGEDDPDYYKSYVPCEDNQDGQERESIL